MKDVKIKKEDKKEEKKAKKAVNAKKDVAKAEFMKARNEARKAAKLPAAYSEEEIKAHL